MRVYRVYIPKKYAIMNTLPTNVLYDIYCPKSDGSVILLGWSSINARQMLSVSRATIVLPCMAMTDKSESPSVVIVNLSQVWSLWRQENDLSASVLPIGKTARIFSSSRILGKKIPSAWLAIMDATDSSGIASCLFQWFDQRNSSLSNAAGSGRICSHFSFRTLRRLVTAFSSFLLITAGTRAHKLIMSLLFVAETGLQFRWNYV